MKFTDAEKSVLLTILLALLAGIIINTLFSYNKKIESVRIKKEFTAININAADPELLCALPGIGPAYAERIINYRGRSGGFKKKEDLMKVKGIGPKKYEKISHLIDVK